MIRGDDRLLALAYHEAGHAVTALAHGLDVPYLYLRRRGNSAGHIGVDGLPNPVPFRVDFSMSEQYASEPIPEPFWTPESVGLLGGIAAETIAFGKATGTYRGRSGDGDLNKFDGTTADFDLSYAEAERTLYAHWPAVHGIATAAYSHRWLPGAEVKRIFEAAQ